MVALLPLAMVLEHLSMAATAKTWLGPMLSVPILSAKEYAAPVKKFFEQESQDEGLAELNYAKPCQVKA